MANFIYWKTPQFRSDLIKLRASVNFLETCNIHGRMVELLAEIIDQATFIRKALEGDQK